MQPGHVVIHQGDLDFATTPAFEAQCSATLQADPRDMIIDLGEVRFVDSAGLGTLIELKRLASELGTSFCLRDVQPQVHRVIELTGLLNVLDVESD